MAGIYSSLVEIFKVGQRKELISKIAPVMSLINTEEDKEAIPDTTTLRLLKCKLAQRMGMVYLRPRNVVWA